MVYRVIPGLKFMRIYLVVHLVLRAVKLRVLQMEMGVNDAIVILLVVTVALIVRAVVLTPGELIRDGVVGGEVVPQQPVPVVGVVVLAVRGLIPATGELAGVGKAVPLEVLRVGLSAMEPGPVAGVRVLQRGSHHQRGHLVGGLRGELVVADGTRVLVALDLVMAAGAFLLLV